MECALALDVPSPKTRCSGPYDTFVLSPRNLLPKSLPPKSPTSTTRPSPLSNPPVNAGPSPCPVPPPSPIRPLNIVKGKERVTSPPSNKPPSPLPATQSFSVDSPPKAERSETHPTPALSSSPPFSVVRRSCSSLSLHHHSRSRSRLSLQGRRSGETDTSHSTDTRTNTTSPPPFGSPPSRSLLGRNGSLRSKLSLPTLRIRSEKLVSQENGSPRSPTSSVANSEQDQRTVQVNDAEFEMVMPLSPVPSANEDGFSLPPPSPINPDRSLRIGSRTFSVTSSTSTGTRLRAGPVPTGVQPLLTPTKPPASPATAEAYRKRELN